MHKLILSIIQALFDYAKLETPTARKEMIKIIKDKLDKLLEDDARG